MDISFDQDVHTSNAIEWNLNILVLCSIAHSAHISAARVVLLVAWSKSVYASCDSLLDRTFSQNDVW